MSLTRHGTIYSATYSEQDQTKKQPKYSNSTGKGLCTFDYTVIDIEDEPSLVPVEDTNQFVYELSGLCNASNNLNNSCCDSLVSQEQNLRASAVDQLSEDIIEKIQHNKRIAVIRKQTLHETECKVQQLTMQNKILQNKVDALLKYIHKNIVPKK